jgi:ABC-type Mn2+/Zn2+ transport system ATPase subunit
MKLNSFKAEKVHGHLRFDIEFFPDLTFLIGINGSGKTTALKLILGLISPSYQYLNQIQFETAELICSTKENERDIIISAVASQQTNTIKLKLISPKASIESPEIQKFTKLPDDGLDVEDVSVIEQSHRESFEVLDITKAIRDLATPKFLGLDRKIYEGKAIDQRLRRRMYIQKKGRRLPDAYSGSTALDGSLEEVQHLIFDYFRTIAYRQPNISEEFKKKVFRLSFNFIEDDNLTMIPSSDTGIIEKRDKVLKAVSDLDLNYLTNQVNAFYGKMIEIIRQNQKFEAKPKSDDLDVDMEKMQTLRRWFNNSSQLKRIEEIINFSQTYQESIAELRSPIKRFENITSSFLKEGRKQLEIAADGEIRVNLRDGKKTTVYELSSGEKQIVIMIAHLIFEEDQQPSGVFIIDEPELSLHLAWQELFVDSITQASPKTQFILATHSPSIISTTERETKCQDINKLNFI